MSQKEGVGGSRAGRSLLRGFKDPVLNVTRRELPPLDDYEEASSILITNAKSLFVEGSSRELQLVVALIS